jgi:uncharacterized protein YggU (UPF0235/DUF167 family)
MAERTRLLLRVAPGALRNAVVGRYGAAWKLRVTGAPARGQANADVLRLLARTLDVPERSLSLVSGHGSRDKVVELHGLDAAEAERRLEQAG